MPSCENRRVIKPLDSQAVRRANAIQPECRTYSERKAWMAAYIAAGGAWECADPHHLDVGEVKINCQDKGPNDGTTVKHNSINIAFDPAKSTHDIKCSKIVHVQFNRRIADGKVIKPSESAPNLAFKDALTTKNGWTVDCMQSETTPDYQQGGGHGYGDVGKKNGGTANATLFDAPSSPTIAKNGGFYDAKTNPKGVKKYEIEFSAFAYCMAGADCGKWYEGVRWCYTKTYKDAANGDLGSSKVTKNCVTGPSKEQLDAFNLFNTDRGFTPCAK